MGRTLLDLHLGFESVEPYGLERVDSRPSGNSKEPRVILRADQERGAITLDAKTTLTGVPESALALPPRQPLRPGVGAGPVQGKEAPRPTHP